MPLDFTDEALFRHHVVSCVLTREMCGEARACVVDTLAACEQRTLCGEPRVVGRRTIYRWLAAFAGEGICGLEPKARAKTASSVVLPERFVEFLRGEKRDDPEASIPEIIRRAEQDGILASIADVDRVTVYRAAVRMGLPLTQKSSKRNTDMRRFVHPHRMRVILADGKHFRVGKRRTKRVVLFFLDDCTRRGLTAVVGPSESTALFLRGLYEVTLHFGFTDVVFLDRGTGFRSHDTRAVIVRLESLLILGTAGYPEGHGKIEAFNKTAWNDLLRGFLAHDIDDDCGALELRCRHYLERMYNTRVHESLDGNSPLGTWDADARPLRFPPSADELRERFVLTETRKVSADNIVQIDGTDYEVPLGHATTVVPVRRNLLGGAVAIVHEQRLVRLHPVDLAANAEARRYGGGPARSDDGHLTGDDLAKPPLTAAARAFHRDYGSLVDKDGGLQKCLVSRICG
jgi:transposase InsO family protein